MHKVTRDIGKRYDQIEFRGTRVESIEATQEVSTYVVAARELLARAKFVRADSTRGRKELLQAARRFVKAAIVEELRDIIERGTGQPCEVRIAKRPAPSAVKTSGKKDAVIRNPGDR